MAGTIKNNRHWSRDQEIKIPALHVHVPLVGWLAFHDIFKPLFTNFKFKGGGLYSLWSTL